LRTKNCLNTGCSEGLYVPPFHRWRIATADFPRGCERAQHIPKVFRQRSVTGFNGKQNLPPNEEQRPLMEEITY